MSFGERVCMFLLGTHLGVELLGRWTVSPGTRGPDLALHSLWSFISSFTHPCVRRCARHWDMVTSRDRRGFFSSADIHQQTPRQGSVIAKEINVKEEKSRNPREHVIQEMDLNSEKEWYGREDFPEKVIQAEI